MINCGHPLLFPSVSCAPSNVNHVIVVVILLVQVPKEKVNVCLLQISVCYQMMSKSITCLDDIKN